MADPTKPVARRKVKKVSHLDEGDTIEISVSANIRISGSEVWIRVAATTELHPGETHSHAGGRVQAAVEEQLEASTTSLVDALS